MNTWAWVYIGVHALNLSFFFFRIFYTSKRFTRAKYITLASKAQTGMQLIKARSAFVNAVITFFVCLGMEIVTMFLFLMALDVF